MIHNRVAPCGFGVLSGQGTETRGSETNALLCSSLLSESSIFLFPGVQHGEPFKTPKAHACRRLEEGFTDVDLNWEKNLRPSAAPDPAGFRAIAGGSAPVSPSNPRWFLAGPGPTDGDTPRPAASRRWAAPDPSTPSTPPTRLSSSRSPRTSGLRRETVPPGEVGRRVSRRWRRREVTDRCRATSVAQFPKEKWRAVPFLRLVGWFFKAWGCRYHQ